MLGQRSGHSSLHPEQRPGVTEPCSTVPYSINNWTCTLGGKATSCQCYRSQPVGAHSTLRCSSISTVCSANLAAVAASSCCGCACRRLPPPSFDCDSRPMSSSAIVVVRRSGPGHKSVDLRGATQQPEVMRKLMFSPDSSEIEKDTGPDL
jgi:hypothetical protein